MELYYLRDAIFKNGKEIKPATVIFDKILPTGTMVKLSMAANIRTRHAVPVMENVGRSGSIVSRMIKTSLTLDVGPTKKETEVI